MTGAFARQAIVAGSTSLESPPAGLNVNVLIVNVSCGGDARVGPYYTGDAKSVTIVTTDAPQIQIRGGGSPGLAATEFRNAQIQYADIQNTTASKAGIITGAAMPYEFYVFDTSGSTNLMTLYFNY